MLNRNAPRIVFLFLCLVLTAFSPEIQAATTKVPVEQLEKIQRFYRNLTSLGFDFKQITDSNGRIRKGAGTSTFYRPSRTAPGIMRWDYSEPGKQIILNDGKELSIYTEKDKQLLIMSAKKLQSDITYSFFVGKRDLKQDFNLLPPDPRFTDNAGVRSALTVQLVPKQPHGQIKSLHFWFDKESKIRRIVMEDHFETTTDLLFSNITFNALPADSSQATAELVRLKLPSDTEIVRQ